MSAIYGSSLAIVAIGAVTGLLTARLLGAEAKGEVALAQAAVALVSFVISLSIDQAIIYATARSPDRDLRTLAFSCGFVLGSVATGVTVLIVGLTEWLPGDERVYLITAISGPFGLSGLFGISVLQGWGLFRRWNSLRLLSAATYLLCLVAIVPFGLTTALASWCFTCGALLFWLIAIVTVFRTTRTATAAFPPAGGSRSQLRSLFGFGLRAHLGSVQTAINSRGDILLLGFFASTTDVGRYTVAVSIAAPLAMVGPALAGYLFPRVSAGTGTVDIVRYLIATSAALAPLAAAGAIVAAPLVEPVFGTEFGGLLPTVSVLCAATVPLALAHVLTSWAKGAGWPHLSGYTEALALVVMISTTPYFADQYGELGAAVVSLFTYSASALAAMWFYLRFRVRLTSDSSFKTVQ